MRSLLLVAAMLFTGSVVEAKDVYVRGYTKSNGTYVQPHHRTAPDHTTSNNYSTQGNVNPYTGKEGTVNPYGSSSSDAYKSTSDSED